MALRGFWILLPRQATLLTMCKDKITAAIPTKLTSKGNRRFHEILGAASAILLDRGFRAVNKRSVASRLKISDGNVSYYFPTKESLWLAVIDHQLAEYYRRHHPESSIPRDDAQKTFDDYISRWIDEYQDPMVRVFFSQIITVAETSKRIAAKRDEIYEAFVESMLSMAHRVKPRVKAKEMEQRVLTAIAVLEGLHAVSAFRPALLADNRYYKARVISLVNAIVQGKVA